MSSKSSFSFSTDFDVHRNWLAITRSLPVDKWYTEATSEWTLDYPPFFAWFEKFLSFLASHFDPKMLIISSEPYFSTSTLIYQRLSVIVSDFIYFYSVYQWVKIMPKLKFGLLDEKLLTPLVHSPSKDSWFDQRIIITILFLINPGLLMVDHIHFQYNGFLSGIFLLSVLKMMEGKFVQSSFLFSVLLNFKHIYLYVSPAYFVYILRYHCLDRHYNVKVLNFLQVAATVIAVFGVSIGPFLLTGSLNPLISRLFPFKRGLTHAYWAPNFWSMYNFGDKLFSIILRRSGNRSSSTSSGLVQEVQHFVLPSVSPFMTLLLVVSTMIPALIHCWRKLYFSFNPTIIFLRLVILMSFCSFLFGFHVHEKAILLIIVPMTPLIMINKSDAINFFILSVTGTYSLFPLLFKPAEGVTKILVTLLWVSYAFPAIRSLYKVKADDSRVAGQHAQILRDKILSKFNNFFQPLKLHEFIYLAGFLVIHTYCSFIHSYILGLDQKLPFVPLMLTSVYCSIGVVYSFIMFYNKTLNYD